MNKMGLSKEIEEYIKGGNFSKDDYCNAREDFGLKILKEGDVEKYNEVPEIFNSEWEKHFLPEKKGLVGNDTLFGKIVSKIKPIFSFYLGS